MSDEPTARERYDWADVHEQLGRLDGRLDELSPRLDELLSRLSQLDCGKHEARLELLERQMAAVSSGSAVVQPRNTSDEDTDPGPRRRRPSEEAVTRHDVERRLEESGEIIIGKAERAILEKLRAIQEEQASAAEKVVEKSHKNWEWRLSIAQKIAALLIALAAGSGLTWVARCNPANGSRPHEGAAVKHEHLKRALMPPAAGVDANMRR